MSANATVIHPSFVVVETMNTSRSSSSSSSSGDGRRYKIHVIYISDEARKLAKWSAMYERHCTARHTVSMFTEHAITGRRVTPINLFDSFAAGLKASHVCRPTKPAFQRRNSRSLST